MQSAQHDFRPGYSEAFSPAKVSRLLTEAGNQAWVISKDSSYFFEKK